MIALRFLVVLLLSGLCSSEHDIEDSAVDIIEDEEVASNEIGDKVEIDKLSVVEQVLQDFEQSIQENQAENNLINSSLREEPVISEEEGGAGEGEGAPGGGGEAEGAPGVVGEVDGQTSAPEKLNSKPKAIKTRINCIQLCQQVCDGESDENCTAQSNLQHSGQLVLINGTELQVRMSEETNANVTNRTSPGICSIILFYGNWCQFSARAAPSFNALPRFFPNLNFYAIEVANNLNIFSQYAVVALPSVLVFHNGKPVLVFNNSNHNLETYVEFVSNYTGMKPTEEVEVQLIDQDYQGPVPNTIVERFNYNLLLAYLFILLCVLVNLSKSSYVTNLTDTLRNLWREVEIQHEHAD